MVRVGVRVRYIRLGKFLVSYLRQSFYWKRRLFISKAYASARFVVYIYIYG